MNSNYDIMTGTRMANEHHKQEKLNRDKIVIYESCTKLKQPTKVHKDGLSAKNVIAILALAATVIGGTIALNKIYESNCERLGLEPGTVISVGGDGGGATGDYFDETMTR